MGHNKIVYDRFEPPTGNPADCECGGATWGKESGCRHPLPNCLCCKGVHWFKMVPCDCGNSEQDLLEEERKDGGLPRSSSENPDA